MPKPLYSFVTAALLTATASATSLEKTSNPEFESASTLNPAVYLSPIAIKGLSPKPRGQNDNMAPEESVVSVRAASDNGQKFCSIGGLISASKKLISLGDFKKGVKENLGWDSIFAKYPAVEGKRRAPITDARVGFAKSENDFGWQRMGFPLQSFTEAGLLESDAKLQIGGTYYAADIDPNNSYNLRITDPRTLNTYVEALAKGEPITAYALSANERAPKVGQYISQGNRDVSGELTACLQDLEKTDVIESRVPTITFTPIEMTNPDGSPRFPVEELKQIFGMQCLPWPEDAAQSAQLVSVDHGTGLLAPFAHGVKFPQGIKFADGTSLPPGSIAVADYIKSQAPYSDSEGYHNGLELSESLQDDTKTTCLSNVPVIFPEDEYPGITGIPPISPVPPGNPDLPDIVYWPHYPYPYDPPYGPPCCGGGGGNPPPGTPPPPVIPPPVEPPPVEPPPVEPPPGEPPPVEPPPGKVPNPSSAFLLAAGMIAFAARRLRPTRKTAPTASGSSPQPGA